MRRSFCFYDLFYTSLLSKPLQGERPLSCDSGLFICSDMPVWAAKTGLENAAFFHYKKVKIYSQKVLKTEKRVL